jgi:hypothetical protein
LYSKIVVNRLPPSTSYARQGIVKRRKRLFMANLQASRNRFSSSPPQPPLLLLDAASAPKIVSYFFPSLFFNTEV